MSPTTPLKHLTLLLLLVGTGFTCVGQEDAKDTSKEAYRSRTKEFYQFVPPGTGSATKRLKIRNDLLEEHFESIRRRIEREKFSVQEGGVILRRDFGKIRMELGAFEGGSQLTLLRFSW